MNRSPLLLGLITGVLVAAGVAWLMSGLTGTSEPVAEIPRRLTPTPATAAAAAVDPTPKKADYAGRLSGGRGLVALSIRGGKAVGYFCDGQRETWLKGTATNNVVTLAGAQDEDVTLEARLREGRATGRLGLDGDTWRFTAATVKKPSGLYRATQAVRGSKIVGGWIVLPSGRQVGAISFDGLPEPAPLLTPGEDVRTYGVTLRPEGVDAFFDGVVDG
ncbi:hypothetical protein [Nonomuraea sp. LPB2021202275-12-8]|uniref:hypothetical protein n=1 Tax=Nonomuraea sp. LPB2021202275-12-8 TaxID=3120159 RepID=UPI00300C480B